MWENICSLIKGKNFLRPLWSEGNLKTKKQGESNSFHVTFSVVGHSGVKYCQMQTFCYLCNISLCSSFAPKKSG